MKIGQKILGRIGRSRKREKVIEEPPQIEDKKETKKVKRGKLEPTTLPGHFSVDGSSEINITNGIVKKIKEKGFDDATALAGGQRPRTLLLRPDSELDVATGDAGALGNLLKPQTPMGTSSRLSKTLQEVLYDKDALAYFIQYMTSRDAEHIIKFWLDAGSFQASSWTRIRTHSLNKINTVEKTAPQPGSTNQQQSTPGEEVSQCRKAGNMAMNVTSPGHAGHTEEENPMMNPSLSSTCSGENISIRRTGTAEANLNLLSHNAVSSPTSSNGPDCDDCGEGGYTSCAKGESDASSGARFAEAGAHGTDPRCECSHQTHCDHAAAAASSSAPENKCEHCGPPPQNNSATALPAQQHGSQTTCTNNPSKLVKVAAACDNNSEGNHPKAQPAGTPLLDTSHETSFQEKLRKSIEKDAVNIYSKYISLDATHPIGITEDLRNEAISRICREDGQVDPRCFTGCQEFVVTVMEKDYFQGFLRSDFHCKHQIDILTGSQVHLADVLYNEAALFYFMEFMEQEGAIDLLQCWLAIDNFQQQLSIQHGKYDAVEAQNDAMVIYEKYFSLQATNPLGFDDSVRFEVECNICREGGPLPDCFVTAKRQVLRTIDKVYFPQFLTSDLYFKFLHELINTIHSAGDIPGYRRKRAGSDASSEHSVGSKSVESESANSSSTKNTLLAMDTSQHNIKKALTKINDDMRIDNTLLNPENLWQRPQAGNMSLGRINEVGQFISEFAPNPDNDKKKGTSGAVFFKRRKDEKTQEEMAIQIAQMIINDVSLATGGGSDTEESQS